MSKFNIEQEKAIKSTGNVIVSAGAGSGKTTVLTERVIQNILGLNGEVVNLDELLILTFTNDAASSMKTKIKEALEKNESLAYLVPLVDSAHIETIDAYQKFIVSKYGKQFGYPQNINVLPEDILIVKVVNYLQEIFDELYEENNPTFKEIIYNYCIKNDNKLFDFILSIYTNNLFKSQDNLKFLKEYKEKYLNKNYFDNLILDTDNHIKSDIEELENICSKFLSTKLKEYYLEKLSYLRGVESLKDLIGINEAIGSEEKRDETNKILKEIEEQEIKEHEFYYREKAHEIVSDLCNLSSFDLDAFNKIDVDYQIRFLTFIIDNILVKLVEKSEEFKMSTGYFTFSDISRIATKILKENEDIRNELKHQYKLIMVDECQDNSAEQNEFITLIENNNVFSVGDVKQSIYKFRGAAPNLFKEKYDLYKKGIGGSAIDMNTNYRSRHEILDMVNSIFSILMSDDFGGANYKKDHIIVPGNKHYDEISQNCYKHGVFMIDNAAEFSTDSPFTEPDKDTKIDGEARAICVDIKSRLDYGYEVMDFDTETNKFISRRAQPKDFAILIYKSTEFKTYENVLKQFKLPVKVIYDDSIKKDLTIVTMTNIFKLLYLLQIENRTEKQEYEVKHCLISILRSYISKTSDEEIYNLFKNKSENYKNSIIYKKYAEFARLFKNSPLSEIYLKVLESEVFIENISELKDALNAIDKNNIFYDKTKIMDELGFSLKDLSEFFDRINTSKIRLDQTVYSDGDNAITLTTIHKSKGLEYPCVYIPSLFDFVKPSAKENGDYYTINKKSFLPFFADPMKNANIIGYNFKKTDEYEKAFNEERLRLFYVALTRAKEDVVLVTFDKWNKNYDEIEKIFKNYIKQNELNSGRNVSEDELNTLTKCALNSYEDSFRGADFNDFIKKTYLNLPITPYIDSQFLNFDKKLFDYLKENNIKLENEELDESRGSFDDLFSKNNFSLVNVNVDEFIIQSIETAKNGRLNKINLTKVLYDGVYYYEKRNKFLGQITIYVDKKHHNEKKFLLVFENDEKYFTGKLNEEIYSKCSKFIAYNQIDELIEYLGIFEDRYDEGEELKEIELEVPKLEIRSLNIERRVNLKSKKASKDLDDQVNESAIHYGNHLHALLEIVDFKNPDYSLLKDDANKIKKVVKLLNSRFNLNQFEIYKEYQFEDLNNGTNGIIDLLLVGKDEIIIVDYKLKNIDDENYKYQLKVYKDYVKYAFKTKDIKTCLLSILNLDIEEFDV
ncbi:MAG: UvrD-helicase domain-containing protein [Bacilli bacterium]|nr:UvrD-helicase domain-containing protein [Bacilli bacterium]